MNKRVTYKDILGFTNMRRKLALAYIVASEKLGNFSLLIMRPDFQHHWLHSVPIEKNLMAGRINLTFRKVIPKINGFSN